MEIRLLTRAEIDLSLELVWKTFCEFEAVNYPEDSRQAFYDAIHSKVYLDSLIAYGAFDGSRLVGIIASREEGSHLALFFVDGDYHGQGIGRKLWEAFLKDCSSDIITVHSSIYARDIYTKLGFEQTGEEMEDGGIVYIPMKYLRVDALIEKTVSSEHGTTYYWTNAIQSDITLVFLPGLTADHRLFEAQIASFKDEYKLLVWDCPCHGKSRPYDVFSYANVCSELERILELENVQKAVFIGQSLGGMIAQYYIDGHQNCAAGFVSIDSVPFGDYYSESDLFWLKQLKWMCGLFPDNILRNSMAKMCGATEIAQKRMIAMLSSYDKKELCRLIYIGEAAFIPENRNIVIPCKSMLLLGDKDRVGKVEQYNRAWSRKTGFPLVVIKGASHNANDDQAEQVNEVIRNFLKSIS